ncbi:aminotransferase class III-fold pyridoxal phosphate-dependent enzyme [Aestuariibacter halophilus]|uniref:Aminotransferase class III-fold pyridoxal phosphate-dependent enzyme n=1 Tax=Fluctibacter halophilus TaxID=226011 RepID=A0ABS8G2B1_9ALTE|nr:aminotransferase class III-fold pyridoxal phosphate-dependent enzyme [Aestuariibacter halophilus]MCC2614668.1 aminotransferase class III-fold pyridoxal phosphate-dependent enzyme [Aestuariibacter halophilus]
MPQHDPSNWWMPFTDHRQFQHKPRIFTAAKGSFLTTDDHRQVLDITAGLWCMNLGHGRQEVADAVSQQLMQLDFAPGFQFANPQAMRYAKRICQHTPDEINKVFYTNDGSSAVDTALKMAYAWHQAKGQGTRQRFVSRMGGYHGINIGGTSMQGLANNRKGFPVLDCVDFLPHLLDIEHNAFTKGLPDHGADKADALNDIIAFRGAENIAAVIIEPIIGAGGMVPPPKGYLQKIRQICDEHGIVLIFDEVVTGFGRTGAAFAANEFGVTPDIMTSAKGITGGFVPLGAVFVKDHIYQTIVDNAPDNGPEFFHGTTYAGHPVSCAAANACLDIYEREKLFEQSGSALIQHWQDTLHSLREALPQLVDIRNYGLLGGITFAQQPRFPGNAGGAVHNTCFDRGLLCRGIGNHMVMSPPLTITTQEIDVFAATFIDAVRKTLN